MERHPCEIKAFRGIPWVQHILCILTEEDIQALSLFSYHWDGYLNRYMRFHQIPTVEQIEYEKGVQRDFVSVLQQSGNYKLGRDWLLRDGLSPEGIVQKLDAKYREISHKIGPLPEDVVVWRGVDSDVPQFNRITDYQTCSLSENMGSTFSRNYQIFRMELARGTMILPMFLAGLSSEYEIVLPPQDTPVHWGITFPPPTRYTDNARETVVHVGTSTSSHAPNLAISLFEVMDMRDKCRNPWPIQLFQVGDRTSVSPWIMENAKEATIYTLPAWTPFTLERGWLDPHVHFTPQNAVEEKVEELDWITLIRIYTHAEGDSRPLKIHWCTIKTE